MTDIKYKLNIIIANQNDGQNVCTICKKNEADEKSEEEEKLFVSMLPVKNDNELQKLERFLIDNQNRAKLVRHLYYKQFVNLIDIYVSGSSTW